MENNFNLHYVHEEEEEEDTLSLCNLPLDQDDDVVSFQNASSSSSSEDDQFEFLPVPARTAQLANPNPKRIVFCGKLIDQYNYNSSDDDHHRNPPPSSPYNHFIRSGSGRVVPSSKIPTDTGNHRYYSTTSMALARSRVGKRLFAFGMVKVPTEMDLSDMRKRQSRRNPAPMFPPAAADGAGEPAANVGLGIGRRGHWGLLRLLKGRPHIGSALARSSAISCISFV